MINAKKIRWHGLLKTLASLWGLHETSLTDQYHIMYVHIGGLITIQKWNILLGSYLGLRGLFYMLKNYAIFRGFYYPKEWRSDVKNKRRGSIRVLTELNSSCWGDVEHRVFESWVTSSYRGLIWIHNRLDALEILNQTVPFLSFCWFNTDSRSIYHKSRSTKGKLRVLRVDIERIHLYYLSSIY